MKSIKRIDLKVRREILAESKEPYLSKIAGPNDLARIAQAILQDVDREHFLVFPVDCKNRILGYVEAAKGSVDLCMVDTREVFRASIIMGASGVFLAHNHPSGDKEPSQEDRSITKRLVQSGKLLQVPVIDHLIVTEDAYYSFAEHGTL
jgi:DNA repair protein RadC